MKTRFLAFVALAIQAFAATAPDSIAGKVYHVILANITARTLIEQTIVFREDGRFTFLKAARGSPLAISQPNKVALEGPSGDGTYQYQRTGESTGSVELSLDNGTKQTITLPFTSPTGGGIPASASNAPSSFYFTDLSALQAAPAANISMRGRVTPGQPLIVGFIVPGAALPVSNDLVPPPGARLQEVLIRVVGPTLTTFGVADVWADPDFTLFKSATPARVNEWHYADWASTRDMQRIFDFVGAFPLTTRSKDAADVVRLDPGAYTIVCNPAAGDAGGEVLVEVYFLP